MIQVLTDREVHVHNVHQHETIWLSVIVHRLTCISTVLMPQSPMSRIFTQLGPVVERVDNTFDWTNRYLWIGIDKTNNALH